MFFICGRSCAWFVVKASLWIWALSETTAGPGAMAERNEVWVKWSVCEWNTNATPFSRTAACHRHTPKWKRATISLGWVASKQINYLWTMNIAYCSQNCCCFSFINQQIWFTRLDIHIRGSWILITFLRRSRKISRGVVDICGREW